MSTESPSVKSAQRTLELLELVARHPHGMTFVELADQLSYPKSSLHGLLQTVVAMKWLTLDSEDRRYSIGVRPWEVGQAFRPSRDIVIRARRFLREANESLDETIQLGMLDDLDVVYLDKVEGTQPLRLVSSEGSRLPAYVTGIGKALLSGLPANVLDSLDRLSRDTPRTPSRQGTVSSRCLMWCAHEATQPMTASTRTASTASPSRSPTAVGRLLLHSASQYPLRALKTGMSRRIA